MGDAGAPVRMLVVWWPDWPIVAAGAALDEPVAVVHANRVVACSPAARGEGIRMGLRRRDAQARCPELLVLGDDPSGAARAFEPVAAALEALTPRIQVVHPGCVALPTRGPSRYHGGDLALAQAAARLAQAAGPPAGPLGVVGVGVADGLFAATLAARRAATRAIKQITTPTPEPTSDASSTDADGDDAAGAGGVVGDVREAGPSGGAGVGAADASEPGARPGGGGSSDGCVGASNGAGTSSGGVGGARVSAADVRAGGGTGAGGGGDVGVGAAGAGGGGGAGPRGDGGVSGHVGVGGAGDRAGAAGDVGVGGLGAGAGGDVGGGGAGARAGGGENVLVVEVGESGAFLAPLPLRVLELPDLVDVLRRLGLRTLGDLAALPEGNVVARFGTEGRVAQRLAVGLDPRPSATLPPPPDLQVAIELDPPAERVETAAFAARGLADELHRRLTRRGSACTLLLIGAETEHGERHERIWRTDGSFGPAAIADRLRWQLDGWLNKTPPPSPDPPRGSGPDGQVRSGRDGDSVVSRGSGPGGPVGSGPGGGPGAGGSSWGRTTSPRGSGSGGGSVGAWGVRPTGGLTRLWLHPVEVVAAGGRQLSFGAGGGDAVIAAEQAGRAAARVQSLVGLDGVLLPEWRGGRGPEERVALVDAGGATLTEPRPAARREWVGEPWPGTVPDPAPVVVHPSPPPVRLLDEAGYPVRVSGRGVLSADPVAMATREPGRPVPVVRWAGPWPCDERWWDPAGHRRRARLQVITHTGVAHLLVLEAGRWALEATYD